MTSSTAIAQTTVTTPDPNIELRRQQEAERALRSQQEANTNVQLKAPTGKETGRISTNETPCFRIERLTLTGLNPKETQAFQWLVPYANALDPKRGFFTLTRPDNFDPPLGKCLGAEGINTVITRMQNALVAKGYTTSRVLAKAQDLNGGALDLHLMLGRIKDIRYTSNAKSSIPSYPQQPDPKPSQTTALPMEGGDVLNLRDIEMTLENFKRVPTADADIQIEPSKSPSAAFGESDLVIKQEQKSPYRRSLGFSDAGSSGTGKYQANATLSFDQLFWSNDLFYATLSSDLLNGEFKGKDPLERGSQGYIFHYSVPVGYYGIEATMSRNGYFQTVVGSTRNYVYSGTSSNKEVKLSRMVHRDSTAKVTASLKAWQRKSNNYRAQWERNPTTDYLLAGDRFAVGGRFTVRGFDNASLSAENGFLIRQDLTITIPATQVDFYLGYDYGKVYGVSDIYLSGKHLTGAAIGFRGRVGGPTSNLSFDLFWATPISKPDNFKSAAQVTGFTAMYNF